MVGAARRLGSIVGIGELKPVRYSDGETTLGQIARTAKLAVDDAGISPDAIDGVLVAAQPGETPEHAPITVAEYLGLRPHMANVVDLGGATGGGMVWRAAAAITAGMCETVLCVSANVRPRGGTPRAKNRNPIREFEPPVGASGANLAYAMIAQAHMDSFGTTAEQLATVAVRSRANAQLNPSAIFHGVPLTIEDVLASPLISAPIHRLESVMEVAGGAAFVMVSAERASRFAHAPVDLIGAGEFHTHRALSHAPGVTGGPLRTAISKAMSAAGVRVQDLRYLSLYDCYSIVVGITLEDLGICEPGKFGPWVLQHDFSHESDVPVNTHGGQLGFGQAGMAGGFTHIVEAVRQLRGEAIGRQIPNPGPTLVTGNGATLGEATALVLEGR
ncbi:thiolase family protein [Rhodococcus opacus]|uniref:thiolase family protein n=1 Tax=Rhodococcus opacus TaxID=37919 RepID=UPI002235901E|nr:thiolase family protein [Rhodococcus opacus]UZG60320.1 thiolase family protein [Rhodococcus opacus]